MEWKLVGPFGYTIFKILKENLPHKTCQIHVKPHLKNTHMTLECKIFDEKALEFISPSLFWIFSCQIVFMEACMEAAIELPVLCLKSVMSKWNNG